jgi:predicted phosphodiesterase
MRVALLSDVHANLAALEAVLANANAERVEAIWNVGDVVGYGPNPDRVVELMVIEGAVCVQGNHDAAVAGVVTIETFNELAAQAVRWTIAHTTAATREYLAGLPPVTHEGFYTLLHGTLRDPTWEYLTTFDAAHAHFAAQETPYSVVGHTHLPLVIREVSPGRVEAFTPEDGLVVELGEERLAINPGGVGQPRDGDPRSSYAVLDTDSGTIAFHRVEYDIAQTQQRMLAAGLPEALAARLEFGR